MYEKIDYKKLMKLRLAIARVGEMDLQKWWNTKGMLGSYGAMALSRGMPKTHLFAQARVVFEVAKHRTKELFDPSGAVTLWNLPAEVEDQFEDHWQEWLDNPDEWNPYFDTLAQIKEGNVLELLQKWVSLSEGCTEALSSMKRSAEGRAVQISGEHHLDDDLLVLLAAAFSKGESGKPAIPYAKLVN